MLLLVFSVGDVQRRMNGTRVKSGRIRDEHRFMLLFEIAFEQCRIGSIDIW